MGWLTAREQALGVLAVDGRPGDARRVPDLRASLACLGERHLRAAACAGKDSRRTGSRWAPSLRGKPVAVCGGVVARGEAAERRGRQSRAAVGVDVLDVRGGVELARVLLQPGLIGAGSREEAARRAAGTGRRRGRGQALEIAIGNGCLGAGLVRGHHGLAVAGPVGARGRGHGRRCGRRGVAEMADALFRLRGGARRYQVGVYDPSHHSFQVLGSPYRALMALRSGSRAARARWRVSSWRLIRFCWTSPAI